MTTERNVPDTVAIIGGGIGGLAAALALLKRGLDVEVHEQAPELKEVGAGIQISSNGTRVLYALGLEEALERVQVLPSRRVIRHWSTGETWNWFDLGPVTAQRYGTPHVMLHRGDLHGAARRCGARDQARRRQARPAPAPTSIRSTVTPRRASKVARGCRRPT